VTLSKGGSGLETVGVCREKGLILVKAREIKQPKRGGRNKAFIREVSRESALGRKTTGGQERGEENGH